MGEKTLVIDRVHYTFKVELFEPRTILITCNFDNKVYTNYINETNDFWKENQDIFENDFNNSFFRFLSIVSFDEHFIENNIIDFNVIQECNQNLTIIIKYSGFIVLNSNLKIELKKQVSIKEEHQIISLKISQLEKENDILKKTICNIQEQLDKKEDKKEDKNKHHDHSEWYIYQYTNTCASIIKGVTWPMKVTTFSELEKCRDYCIKNNYCNFSISSSGETKILDVSIEECVEQRYNIVGSTLYLLRKNESK
tara:strand:+ start:122 stop:880 length:759 start_codon:yes stop_codon:yes gene_type:complete